MASALSISTITKYHLECSYLSFPPCGLFTSLTANKNWMAQTKRQHKFRDNVKAHNAKVTSYTTTYSSAVITVNCSDLRSSRISFAVTGDIFNKNMSDSSANNKLTEHSNPKLTNISFTPTSLDLAINLLTVLWLCSLDICKPPFKERLFSADIPGLL